MADQEFDDNDDLGAEEEGIEPPKRKFSLSVNLDYDFARYFSNATSFLGLTAIAILTFELVLGTVKLATFLAYMLSTAVMLGTIILMFVAVKWAGSHMPAGLLRWAFWLIISLFAFFYFFLMVFIVYGNMAPAVIKIMNMAMSNIPS